MSDVTATKQTEMVRNLSDLHPPLLLRKHLKKISISTSNGFPYGEKSTLKFVWIKTLDFVGCWYLWCTDTITIIMVIITLHPLRQAVWGLIWKYTAAKSQINATSVAMHPFGQANWWHTWKGMFKIDGVIDLNCTNLAICCGYVGNIK